ncbi:alpha-amylase family glycosyl hydrolase [Roseobacter sinensis]|uniref:Alpha-amylase family glycosyl hydrolase n=1 Tax=Roseobacter sinensis TaxID=2931391 RepID=A0ABT3BJ53_9RHOB|nr:alpha-amylase family glycosyl hydrolase [Roseobacter sp. WL0113]MCV3273384.1 alpha-amylase family glycosyl hydrolase [Roseobacter sp. WL0113]
MTSSWWQGAVIYQIYPRSFQDDNGDGIGDLKGIIRRLPHVADLGADAIWLSPVFTSPMADMGYDVSDYRDIDPTFGTLSEFDALVARAHQLGLKVIIDQVLSHSSDRHPFFQESRLTRDNPKSDWYVWADAKPEGSPPNNWQAIFGGPAWSWDVRRRQYYYHQFLPQQPDLNFHNPEVQAWALETLDFWLDRGVDGFRLDAMNHLFHDADLRDNPPDIRAKDGPDYKPFEMQYPIYSKNRPETVAFTERMRAHVDARGDHALLAELGGDHHSAEQLSEYTAPGRLHLAYNNDLMTADFGADVVRNAVSGVQTGSPCWSFSNHDVPRHIGRWAAHGVDQDGFAKLCCALLLCLPGAICLYQGEELGLLNAELSYDELVDPEGLTFWPDNKGRDGCRTPMPWENGVTHAGFSNAETTWLPVKSEQAARAVDLQDNVSGSVLSFYRDMIALRQKTDALKSGATRFEDTSPDLLAFWRGETVFCAFNLGKSRWELTMPPGLSRIIASEGVVERGDCLDMPANGFALFAAS